MDFLDIEDQIFTHYAEKYAGSEIERAKLEFIKLSGPFDSDDDLLEEKMTHFREWFLFDFKINGETLVSSFSIEDFKKIGLDEKSLEAMSTPIKSIFYFNKIKNDLVYVKDLFSKNSLVVSNSPYLVGVEKGTYFQARVMSCGESLCFGQSVVSHPLEARKYIDKKIKTVKKEMKKGEDTEFLKDSFLKELFSMRYHLVKYKQLKVTQIYSDESPVKELLQKSL